jgi:ribosomal protein S27E
MSDDLTLDGNGVSGLLADVLGGDPSTFLRRCPSCGQEHVLGEHRAYRGAGLVLRCPGCEHAAVIIGVQEQRLIVRMTGAFTVNRLT